MEDKHDTVISGLCDGLGTRPTSLGCRPTYICIVVHVCMWMCMHCIQLAMHVDMVYNSLMSELLNSSLVCYRWELYVINPHTFSDTTSGLCSLHKNASDHDVPSLEPEMDPTERLVVFRMGRCNGSRIFEQFPCVRHIVSTKAAIPYGECIIHEISMKGMFSASRSTWGISSLRQTTGYIHVSVERACREELLDDLAGIMTWPGQ
jgi:hypothetical protein